MQNYNIVYRKKNREIKNFLILTYKKHIAIVHKKDRRTVYLIVLFT